MRFNKDVDLERVLVAEARSGNVDAFATLLTEYRSQIYRIALKITDNHEDANDVLQEALLNAYLHLETFRGESRFSTWLVRIVAHQAMSRVRRRVSRREVSLDNPLETEEDLPLSRDVVDAGDDPETRYSKTELLKILIQVIDYLEPGLRVVLVMHELGTLSMQEISEALAVSVPVAKSRLFRARQKLREHYLRRIRERATRARLQATYNPC
ncbi:MAG TPA: sigma-70 family RNA polymerase sigma factor [Acidobacteriota bacterium]|nr:sigma-70 family RNA polymerase sigma factor [Acidobacteriota bacterium]